MNARITRPHLARMRTSALAFAAVGVLLFTTACTGGPPRDTQMMELNGLVHQMSLNNFEWTRDNATNYWPYMDWSSDNCSGPQGGETFYELGKGCRRHDFSWRNLKRITDTFSQSSAVWNGRNKRSADDQFLEDGYTRCDEIWWALGCDDVAYGMYLAVGSIPPYHVGWPGEFSW